MVVASLNSGSNGNCYYLATDADAVLVDAGLSWKQIRNRLDALELDHRKIRAVFISHEHSDHIFGLKGLHRHTGIPVYLSPPTLKEIGRSQVPAEAVQYFTPHEPVDLGSITVVPFPISHDAADPHNFLVTGADVTAGIFTDLGYACPVVRAYFARCHAVFLETNYDEEKLRQSRYPAHLQERIRGNRGHLSNLQALELLQSSRSEKLSHVFLSHLSAENNSPELARNVFATEARTLAVHVTSRNGPTGPFHLRNGSREGQLSLFFNH